MLEPGGSAAHACPPARRFASPLRRRGQPMGCATAATIQPPRARGGGRGGSKSQPAARKASRDSHHGPQQRRHNVPSPRPKAMPPFCQQNPYSPRTVLSRSRPSHCSLVRRSTGASSSRVPAGTGWVANTPRPRPGRESRFKPRGLTAPSTTAFCGRSTEGDGGAWSSSGGGAGASARSRGGEGGEGGGGDDRSARARGPGWLCAAMGSDAARILEEGPVAVSHRQAGQRAARRASRSREARRTGVGVDAGGRRQRERVNGK